MQDEKTEKRQRNREKRARVEAFLLQAREDAIKKQCQGDLSPDSILTSELSLQLDRMRHMLDEASARQANHNAMPAPVVQKPRARQEITSYRKIIKRSELDRPTEIIPSRNEDSPVAKAVYIDERQLRKQKACLEKSRKANDPNNAGKENLEDNVVLPEEVTSSTSSSPLSPISENIFSPNLKNSAQSKKLSVSPSPKRVKSEAVMPSSKSPHAGKSKPVSLEVCALGGQSSPAVVSPTSVASIPKTQIVGTPPKSPTEEEKEAQRVIFKLRVLLKVYERKVDDQLAKLDQLLGDIEILELNDLSQVEAALDTFSLQQLNKMIAWSEEYCSEINALQKRLEGLKNGTTNTNGLRMERFAQQLTTDFENTEAFCQKCQEAKALYEEQLASFNRHSLNHNMACGINDLEAQACEHLNTFLQLADGEKLDSVKDLPVFRALMDKAHQHALKHPLSRNAVPVEAFHNIKTLHDELSRELKAYEPLGEISRPSDEVRDEFEAYEGSHKPGI